MAGMIARIVTGVSFQEASAWTTRSYRAAIVPAGPLALGV
jgi:hypothetical protein